MKLRTLLTAVSFVFHCCGYCQWKLIWDDEFNYNGLPDSVKWSSEVGFVRGNESQFYTKNRIENERVEGGNLVIETRKENYQSAKYTSASLHTRFKGDWLYGKFEMRAMLPRGRGIWPAIWMMATNDDYGGWPNCGEIDIMESVGFDPFMIYMTIHTGMFNGSKGTQIGSKTRIDDPYDHFHIYRLEWFPDRLDFYVDDVKYMTYPKASDDKSIWPYDRAHYLIMNVAVGGNWGSLKGIDDSIFPQKMYVDYVRVYQKEDNK
ncbi:MAG: glycoside hydrolase family 16 protein [Chitinophagaceae bacterium]|nr:glycoside hydrolase family 16 protein [Chitinophagaceae bacterium]